jgi:AcrR family transcriptional regulator
MTERTAPGAGGGGGSTAAAPQRGGPGGAAAGGRRRRGRPRNRRGEGGRLREELLAAARDLLEDGGSEAAVTIRAVTRRAGVAPQAFYLHFEDRDALLWAVYAAAFAELEAVLAGAEAHEPAAAGKLRARCRAHCAYALAHPGSYRVLFGVVGTYKPQWAGGDLPGTSTFRAWVAAVSRCIDAGQARPGDPARVAVLLLGAVHGLLLLRLNRPTFPWPPIDVLVEDLLTNLVGLPATDAALGGGEEVRLA